MKKVIVLLLAAVPLVCLAQEKKRDSTRHLRIIKTVGTIWGDSKTEFLAQVSIGMVFQEKAYIGIGGGYDGYKRKSYPLYLDAQYAVDTKNRFFLYGQSGYHFPEKRSEKMWGDVTNKWQGSVFLDGGVGIRLFPKTYNKVLFAVGFSQKKFVNKITYPGFCPIGDCSATVIRYDHNLSRLVVKLSWEIR